MSGEERRESVVPRSAEEIHRLQRQALGMVFAVSQRDEKGIELMLEEWGEGSTVILAGLTLMMARQAHGSREDAEEWLRGLAMSLATKGPFQPGEGA